MPKENRGGGKKRKPGDWITIERGRRNKERFHVTSRGLSNVPMVGEVGSAAYRRLIAKRAKKNAAK